MKLLPVLALIAAYAAVAPGDRLAVADLHRKREKVVDGLDEDETKHLDSVLRAVETSQPSDEARVTAESLSEHLPELEEGEDYSAENPNGPHGNASTVEDFSTQPNGQAEDQNPENSKAE